MCWLTKLRKRFGSSKKECELVNKKKHFITITCTKIFIWTIFLFKHYDRATGKKKANRKLLCLWMYSAFKKKFKFVSFFTMFIKNKQFLNFLLDLAKLRLIITIVYVSFCFIFRYIKDFLTKSNSGTLKFNYEINKDL